MRIAYISYEHPLGIQGGGIGTYLGQIAKIMAKAGHQVEVFTCHSHFTNTIEFDGYLVHRVRADGNIAFRENSLPLFTERHRIQPFDIIEAAEYGADALLIKKKFPELPLVVKLHTPSYLTQELNDDKATTAKKIRFMLGGIMRGKMPKRYWVYKKELDIEYEQYRFANAAYSPTNSLAHLIKQRWPDKKHIEVIPNPFEPGKPFLDLPVAAYAGGEMVVSFLGRLEKRKGILDLMEAIPLILKKHPQVILQFAGKSHPSPDMNLDMEGYLKRNLSKWHAQLRFFGHQPYDKIAQLLSKTHVCIFPSLWENFPNVCLEAMASGRAVVASNNGGMTDMITDSVHGLLVPPNSPGSIAEAIDKLVENPALISKYGFAAREKVLDEYNEMKIGPLVMNFYNDVI